MDEVNIAGISVSKMNGVEYFAKPGGRQDYFGYIGVDFLRSFLLVLDYQKKVMAIYRGGEQNTLSAACGKHVFPISLKNGYIQSTVDTEFGPRLFQWDTGSSENVLRPSSVFTAGSFASATQPGLYAFSELKFPGFSLGRVVFPLREFMAPNVDGVFGTEFLKGRWFASIFAP